MKPTLITFCESFKIAQNGAMQVSRVFLNKIVVPWRRAGHSCNRPFDFRVAFCLCFETKPGAKPFHINEFVLHGNVKNVKKNNSFPNERFCSRPHFKTGT